uniref:NADH dehydrogenase subunit 2 n=1 Tax=Smittia aterrima TaxID=611654 RepID=UPI0022DCD961|nr:NADH dehydrogenase subunit 2 [Smittia aterrima]WAB46353.1 NADH dehydrogenase subunit 2 [Smittia aterrima]
MFKNSYKFLFFLTLMMGSLISISSTSWFSVWMGLEINLLSFIPLMMNSKNLFSSESSLKYFLTQALASSIFLFSIMMFLLFVNFNLESNLNNYLYILISSSMLIKSGAAPFHFWFPSVMEGLNWQTNLILMTWQKMAPLMIISYCLNMPLLMIITIFSIIFGCFGGLNQTCLRKLMAFSSINHLGWMMMSMNFNENLWFSYFLFYTMLTTSMILVFNNFKLFNINQIFNLFSNNFFMKLLIFIPLLSLGGLPPFLGFFPKWIIIEMMIFTNLFFLLTLMLFLTLITLYFYLRIMYSALLMNYLEMNWKYNFFTFKNNFMLIFFSFTSLFGMILINFIFFIL